MRTSRISQETTRIFHSLSPNARATGRTTRSSKRLASFALGYDGQMEVKEEATDEVEVSADAESKDSRSSNQTPDIEDAVRVATPPRSGRKRKFGSDTPIAATSVMATVKTEQQLETTKWTSPRKIKKEEEQEDEHDDATEPSSTPARAKAKPKIPARRATSPSGTVRIHPPSNWEEIYNTVQAMRQRNPTAPVDTMGCEDLFWPTSPPIQKRYHHLTALMLSSQTKDTVTAVAMHRLHTELVAQEPSGADGKITDSALTVDNILACDPKHLDTLIGKVGFHNNKTKYIKSVAAILKAEYHGDIPNTVEGLVRLPGVGPKMAYLCMSAAWGIDEGIGVDVHVHRITNLWGWHSTKTPEETRAWLEGWLPREKWHEINKLLVGLGQTVCLPVGRRCGECDLAGTGLCKAEIRGWKPKPKTKTKREKVEVEVVKKEEEEVEVMEETLTSS